MTMTKRPKSLRLRPERPERKSAVARKWPPIAANAHLPPLPGRPGISLGAGLLFILICSRIARDEVGTLAIQLDGVLRRADVDAAFHIRGWLDELLSAGCITLYMIDGVTYVRVVHWHKHQTIH
jgi:hypothetical protein